MRSRTAICLLLMTLWSAACGTAYRSLPEVRLAEGGIAPSLAADASIIEGRRLLSQGKPALAVAELRKALARQGRDSRTLNAMAIAYAELGRHGLSVRYFEEALALAPDDPSTLNNIGFAALRRGETKLAGRYLAKARRVGGGDPEISANLAHLATYEGAVALGELIRREAPGQEEAAAAPGPRVIRADYHTQRLDGLMADEAPAAARNRPPVPVLKPLVIRLAILTVPRTARPGASGRQLLAVPGHNGVIADWVM